MNSNAKRNITERFLFLLTKCDEPLHPKPLNAALENEMKAPPCIETTLSKTIAMNP